MLTLSSNNMEHCAVIDENFGVWVFGQNKFGQLGLGDKIDRILPVKIPNLPPIVLISLSRKCVFFLDDGGFVWYSGEYNKRNTMFPKKVSYFEDIVKISSGNAHFLALDKKGNVFIWGYLENIVYADEPTKIEMVPAIKDISCGYNHSILIDIDGNGWSFGSNFSGQLCHGHTTDIGIPTKIEGLAHIRAVSSGFCYTILIDSDDNVYSCGSNEMGKLGLDKRHSVSIPTQLPLSKIKSSYCGDDHTILLDIDNNALCFGDNKSGQLRLQKHINNINSAICFGDSTIIITSEGDFYGCGFNNRGQLGVGYISPGVKTLTKINIPVGANLIQSKNFKNTKNARKLAFS